MAAMNSSKASSWGVLGESLLRLLQQPLISMSCICDQSAA